MDGIDPRQLKAFTRALEEYTRHNRRELGPLIESRAKRMRHELFRQFRATAPSRERIDQEAAARGHAIRRRKGKDGRTLTVRQELAARKRSIGWLSVSWIFRAWRSRRDGQSANIVARSRSNAAIGMAIVRTAKGLRHPRVILSSYLEGAVDLNARRSLVNRALGAQVADMRRYVARKQQERFMQLVRQIAGSGN